LGSLCYGPAGIVDFMSPAASIRFTSPGGADRGTPRIGTSRTPDASRPNNDIWLPWLITELAKLGLKPAPSVGNLCSRLRLEGRAAAAKTG